MWLLASCFAISFVLATVLSVGNLEFRANLTAKLNPPTNITIVDRQLGELTITWKDNLSEDIKKWSNVRYLFEFKYFDSDDWQEDSRHQDPEYMRTFELHRGVSLRVKNILLDKQRSIVINESNWTLKNIQPPPGDRETLVSNFSCIVYNHSSMNCTWRKGRKAPTDTEYVMYYRQSETTRQCIHYFTKNGRSGCQVDQGIYDAEENILICVNGSNNTGTIRSYYTELDPQEYEIYNPPVNLKVLPNLTVKWEMPPGYVININCFAFELEVTDLDKCNTELLGLHGETEYVLVNINPMKRYSVKVRMKLKHCKETKFWSDWSNEDFIERIHSFNAYQMLLMLAIITAVTGLLLLFVFRRYKVLETVFKPIPDPQKKFKALFEEYNGDFQNWINCQIPISKADECHPVAVEESSEA
ncbi:interleukin-13 receptor subunit alpha-2-like isoform X1 [Scyliorhinus canicula]|uniref:interleukin-13 receptor subunit alpha-2-like isoform X1 n=1 Tax=Scyliorhinus canicula TaxID=7830 RepID=UPI0018F5ACDA|nr:interleukin-13 receptor subunit alpha-2-like isoform X1 [Scyliorhinus canicula]XP_038675031.1 interleukin-13 receptor subunit alpha-2-like isoform X1 [Scyliorhinus canicula]